MLEGGESECARNQANWWGRGGERASWVPVSGCSPAARGGPVRGRLRRHPPPLGRQEWMAPQPAAAGCPAGGYPRAQLRWPQGGQLLSLEPGQREPAALTASPLTSSSHELAGSGLIPGRKHRAGPGGSAGVCNVAHACACTFTAAARRRNRLQLVTSAMQQAQIIPQAGVTQWSLHGRVHSNTR